MGLLLLLLVSLVALGGLFSSFIATIIDLGGLFQLPQWLLVLTLVAILTWLTGDK